MSKRDKIKARDLYLLSEGSTEEMLREYARQVFAKEIDDPLAGIQDDNHTGLALKIEEGLEFMYMQSRNPENITLIRRAHQNREVVAIYFFYGSTFDYYVEHQLERSIMGLVNGIVIHNYSSNVRLSLIKDREFNFVVVRINKGILDKYFDLVSKALKELLFKGKPILLYENLDQKILDHLKSVMHIQSVRHTTRQLIFGKTIELLALVFNKILGRTHKAAIHTNISEYDALVRAKNMLISDWHHPPSIQDLSKHLGMSATKAKMLFKQVFGYPPHQYFKRKRMEAAYHILLEKKYNVTEVGRHLGYKSLSHFSSDFKSYFGVFPKKLAMQVEANEMRSGKSQDTASEGM